MADYKHRSTNTYIAPLRAKPLYDPCRKCLPVTARRITDDRRLSSFGCSNFLNVPLVPISLAPTPPGANDKSWHAKKIHAILIHAVAWVLRKVFSRIMTSIQYHRGQIEVIREVEKKSRQSKIPIVYVPMHRSHSDSFLVGLILYLNQIQPPLVAAGDNLQIFLLSRIMRQMGAFFIRRRLDPVAGKKDHAYRNQLRSYMAKNLTAGNSMGFFIEGGRSRTGKALRPKAGLLSVVVDSVLDGSCPDAYIVPVGITYERLIEGDFVQEQLGASKVKESFTSTIKGLWKTMHSNYGSVRVDFCAPFSLRDYLESVRFLNQKPFIRAQDSRSSLSSPTFQGQLEHFQNIQLEDDRCRSLEKESIVDKIFEQVGDANSDKSSESLSRSVSPTSELNTNSLTVSTDMSRCTSHYGLDVVVRGSDKRQAIAELADHITYEAFNNSAIMATHALAYLFLTQYRNGATLKQLSASLDILRDKLVLNNRCAGFTGRSEHVILYSIKLLGDQVFQGRCLYQLSSNELKDDDSKKSEDNFVCIETLVDAICDNLDDFTNFVTFAPKLDHTGSLILNYYSNNVTSAFLIESIVAIAFESLVKTQGGVVERSQELYEKESVYGKRVKVGKNDLVDRCLELCDLLQAEYIIVKPCDNLEDCVRSRIEHMVQDGHFLAEDPPLNLRKSYYEIDGDEDDNYDDGFCDHPAFIQYIVLDTSSKLSLQTLQTFKKGLSPLLHSYKLVAGSLDQLIDCPTSEKSFISNLISQGLNMIQENTLVYPESVAAENFSNALKLLQIWRVIEIDQTEALKVISLCDEFDSEEALNGVQMRVHKFV